MLNSLAELPLISARFEPRPKFLSTDLEVRVFTQSADPELADLVGRFRAELFSVQLGWSLSITNDGREVDQFDGPDVTMCAVLHNGAVIGCWRALPTTRPYLLSTIFPELLGGRQAPADERSWEITRFGVQSAHALADETATELFSSMFTFADHVNAARLVAVTDVAFERVMRLRGIRTRRYGPPKAITLASGGEMRLVAGEINIAEQTDPNRRADLARAGQLEPLS